MNLHGIVHVFIIEVRFPNDRNGGFRSFGTAVSNLPESRFPSPRNQGVIRAGIFTGFLERISGGKNLYLIPSSIHEWLYIEDKGMFTREELTNLLRSVNSEIVSEEEILSDHLYYYEGKELRRV